MPPGSSARPRARRPVQHHLLEPPTRTTPRSSMPSETWYKTKRRRAAYHSLAQSSLPDQKYFLFPDGRVNQGDEGAAATTAAALWCLARPTWLNKSLTKRSRPAGSRQRLRAAYTRLFYGKNDILAEAAVRPVGALPLASTRPTQVRAAVTPTGSTRCVTNRA